jgi:hypothetical protein
VRSVRTVGAPNNKPRAERPRFPTQDRATRVKSEQLV